jgi:hypothetical protein
MTVIPFPKRQRTPRDRATPQPALVFEPMDEGRLEIGMHASPVIADRQARALSAGDIDARWTGSNPRGAA